MDRIYPNTFRPTVRRNLLLGAAITLVCSTGFSTMALAAPDGGVVVGGNITIDQTLPTTTVVTQTTDRGIIDWRSFDVNTNELVEFKQPNVQSITVNRVKNSTQKTEINGSIKANGNIVILNENGVMFGENSRIDVGGLVASTSDLLDDADFMAGGNVRFKHGNNPNAGIENRGNITAREGGLVGLVSPNVENKGVITAKFGKVQIASADIVTIDFAGDGLIQIDVSNNVTKQIIKQSGIVSADGGEILLTAAAGRAVVDSVIETGGTIKANTIRTQTNIIKTGKIEINAGSGNLQMSGIVTANGDTVLSGGMVYLKGRGLSAGGLISAAGANGGHVDIQAGALSLAEGITAEGINGNGGVVTINVLRNVFETSTSRIIVDGSVNGGTLIYKSGGNLVSSGRYFARGQTGIGGNVDVTGGSVKFLSTHIYADGWTKGGRIRVGGEFQGGKNLAIDEIPNAEITTLDRGTILSANGTGYVAGGGEIIVWSDIDTMALGTITAKPGQVIGKGGFVEISSNGVLNYGATIQTGVGSRAGTVLLDPKNIIIANATFNPTAIIMGRGMTTPNIDMPQLNYGGEFGAYGLSLDGNRMAVGWNADLGADGLGNRAGAVYLYSFTDAAFSGGVLEGIMGRGYTGGKNVNVPLDNTFDRFGFAVSLDGNRIAIGSYSGDGNANVRTDSGEVYLYTFSDAAFNGATLQARIGAGYTGGKNINMTATVDAADLFGSALSLNGNRLAVGALSSDGFGNSCNACGDVYLFTFSDAVFSGGALAGIMGNGYTGGKNVNVALDAVDRFGSSVSLDGNRIAIGAYEDDGNGNITTNSGAVYLYSFTDSVFSGATLEGIIGNGHTGGKNINTSAFANASDQMGWGVSLDGNRLAVSIRLDDGNGNAVGDSGAVNLYSFTDAVFNGGVLEARIGNNYAPLGGKNLSRPNEAGGSDQFGTSVSLDGNRMVVGALGDDGSGNVNTDQGAFHFYTFSDSVFTGGTYQGTLGTGYTGGKNITLHFNSGGDSPGDRMAVSLSDNRIAVGMSYGDGFNDGLYDSGEVYLYSFASSNFDSAVLESIIGHGYTGGKNINLSGILGAVDYFGESLSLDGNRLVVGARGDDGNLNALTDSGAVYLFSFTDALFSGGVLESRLGRNYGALGGKNFSVANLTGTSDWFGSSVSLDGNRLAVTASRDDGNANSLTDSGAVYLFTFADSVFTTPTLQGILGAGYGALGGKNFSIANLGVSDTLGDYGGVSLDGNRLALTARGDDGFGNPGTVNDAGAAYLMTFSDALFSSPTLQAIMGFGYTGGKNMNMSMLGASDFLSGVALEGATLALGAARDDGFGNTITDIGAVYIYNFDDLFFSNGTLDFTIGANYTGGKNINTLAPYISDGNDYMGVSLDLNNGTLIVAVPGFDGGNNIGSQNGSVYAGSGGAFIFRGNSNPVTNGNAFATVGANTIGITPANLTLLLNTPQNVILQANNDIIIDDAIIVNNPSGNGGNLTLQAGRSIIINANITTDNGDLFLYANEDLATGVVNAQRDAGAAVVQMGAGTIINAGTGNVTIRLEDGTGKTNTTSGDITLNTINAGTIFVRNIAQTSSVNLNGILTASGAGTPLTIAAGKDFKNFAGASALAAPSGRWLVYSDHPTLNTLGGITSAFSLNNCVYAGACGALSAGNGLLYEYTPNLISVSVNTSRFYGDANPTLATLQSLFVYNGFQGADNASVLDVLPTATIAGSATSTAIGGTTHAITLSGGSDNLYSYYFLDPSFLTVTAKPLTATWIGPITKVYGDANPSPTYNSLTYIGFANSETIGGSYNPSFGVDFNTITAATGVGSYSVTPVWTLGGNFLLNYSITPPAGTLNITKRNITAAWTGGLTKTYGDANPTVTTANFTYTGLVNGDLGTVLTPTANFGALDNTSNVGTYTNAVSATFSAANYNVTNTPTANLVINKRNVTATVASKSRAYGDTNPIWAKATDITYTNLVNGDLASGMDTVAFTATTPNATTNAGTTQSITITSFTDNNYNLTSTTAGIFSITKRDITGVVGSTSRVYGAANPVWNWSNVTWSNLANSETGSVLDILTVSAPTAINTSNAGTTHNIDISGFTDNNYNLTGFTAGTLTITKRDITGVVASKSRIYGDANPTWSWSDVTWSNLTNSETGSVIDTLGFTALASTNTSNAGTTEAIAITSFNDNNYNLLSHTGGTFTINKRDITGVVGSTSRVYGDANPTWNWSNVTWSNLANSETGSVLDALTVSAPSAINTSNAGTNHAINISGFSDNNYNLLSSTAGILTINKRDITGVVGSTSRVYGDANPAWNWSNVTWSNLANSETGSVLDALTVSAPTAINTSNAGTNHAINISGFSDNNYNLLSSTAGILTINKRDITGVVGSTSRAYGDANPAWNWSNVTWSNLANSETGSVLDSVTITAPTAINTSNAGTNHVVFISGFSDNNYNLLSQTSGNLAINKRDITGVVASKSRIYGDANPTWNWSDVTWSNLANSETGSVIDTLGFTATTPNATTNAGTTQSITITSFLDNNYNLLSSTAGTLTITKRDITGVVGSTSRVYGDANPTWNWSNVTWSNLANSETGSVLDALTVSAPSAINTSNAGTTHAINISGFSDNNYNLLSSTAGILTINKRDITALVASKSKAYGDTNPTWILGDITFSNLANSETNSVIDTLTWTTPTLTALSNAGSNETISITSFADNNYNLLSSTAGALTITKRDITASISNTSRAYGAANPAYTWSDVTWGNLANSETGSVLDGMTFSIPSATNTSNAGTNHVVFISGFSDNNYNLLSQTSGNLEITKALLTATAPSTSRAYGDINPVFSINYTGFANSETQSVIDTLASAVSTATQTSNAGSTQTIIPSGASDNNYEFIYVNGILTINKRDITAVVSSRSRSYGAANPTWSWSDIAWSNLANGQNGSVIDALVVASAATLTSNAGTAHAITISGFSDNNYNLLSSTNGVLTVTKANLTLVAEDQRRRQGEPNMPFTFIVSGLQNGDLSNAIVSNVMIGTIANQTTPVGRYAITISGAQVQSNYQIANYIDGELTVIQANYVPPTVERTVQDSIQSVESSQPVASGGVTVRNSNASSSSDSSDFLDIAILEDDEIVKIKDGSATSRALIIISQSLLDALNKNQLNLGWDL